MVFNNMMISSLEFEMDKMTAEEKINAWMGKAGNCVPHQAWYFCKEFKESDLSILLPRLGDIFWDKQKRVALGFDVKVETQPNLDDAQLLRVSMPRKLVTDFVFEEQHFTLCCAIRDNIKMTFPPLTQQNDTRPHKTYVPSAPTIVGDVGMHLSSHDAPTAGTILREQRQMAREESPEPLIKPITPTVPETILQSQTIIPSQPPPPMPSSSEPDIRLHDSLRRNSQEPHQDEYEPIIFIASILLLIALIALFICAFSF